MSKINSNPRELLCPDTYCIVCKQGDYLPMNCDLCGSKLCNEHIGYEAHKCTACIGEDGSWRNPKDKRVEQCPLCSMPISESTVPIKTAEIEKLNREIQEENARITGLFHQAGTITEAEILRDSLNYLHLRKLHALQKKKTQLLLETHLSNGCFEQDHHSKKKQNACSHARCKTQEGFKTTCKSCSKTFCLTHRLPEVHQCGKHVTAKATATPKTATAATSVREQVQQVWQQHSSEESILLAMGFPLSVVRAVLQKCHHSLDAAVDMLITASA